MEAKRCARGDVLIFTDANVLLAEDAIDRPPCRADPQVGGVLGLRRAAPRKMATSPMSKAPWLADLEEAPADAESRTGNAMGADGSIFSVRRALYPEFPDDVLDDLTASMARGLAGKRSIHDVIAHGRQRPARRRDRRKIRISARAGIRIATSARSWLDGRADRFKYARVRSCAGSALLMAIGGFPQAGTCRRFADRRHCADCRPCVVDARLADGRSPRRARRPAAAYVATRGVTLRHMSQKLTTGAPAKSRD